MGGSDAERAPPPGSASAGGLGRGVRNGLRNAIDAYLAFCEREEAVHRFLLAQRGHAGRRVASAPDDVGARIAAGIADGFRSRLAELGLDTSAADPWAHGVVGLVTEAAAWWLITRRSTRDELCTQLMTLLWNGFAGLADAAGEPGRTR